MVWISPEHANNIRQEQGQRNNNLDQLGIFANSLVPSLEMFIPAAGSIIGMSSAVSTELAFNAFALSNPPIRSISTQPINLTSYNNGNPCLFSCHVKEL